MNANAYDEAHSTRGEGSASERPCLICPTCGGPWAHRAIDGPASADPLAGKRSEAAWRLAEKVRKQPGKQDALRRVLGVSQATVSRILNGKTVPDVLQGLQIEKRYLIDVHLWMPPELK